MAVTLADLVKQIRHDLDDEPEEDYIISAVSDTVGIDVSVKQPFAWQAGDILEFPDGEQVKVRVAGANPLQCKRGHNGTTAATHSSGDAVFRNPKFSYAIVVDRINRTLEQLWPYAWGIASTTITISATEDLYALPTGFIDLVSATQRLDPATPKTFAVYGAKESGLPIQVVDGLDTAVFPTGKALYVPSRANLVNGLIVRYRTIPTIASVETGLWEDTILYGALASLGSSRDFPRVQAEEKEGKQVSEALTEDVTYWERKFKEMRALLNYHLKVTTPPMKVWG